MQFINYIVKEEIGHGGMATVYLAEHKTLQRPVAIKVLNKEFVYNQNIRKRFLAEARNMFIMNHPNIVRVIDLIDEDETVAFVMEFVEGKTLKDYVYDKGKLSNHEIQNLFSQMLDAVGYVHEKGYVHRDIKPSNFMLTPKGQIKLMDFGIAKNTDLLTSEYTITHTTQSMGTPIYMSPEQIKSTKDVTFHSDIYSLGIVLWQMIMGKKPYNTSTLSSFELQTKIVNDQLENTNTYWDDIITKATQKEIGKRFDNINIFHKAFMSKTINVEDETVFEDESESRTVIDNIHSTTIKSNEPEKLPSIKIGRQIWMEENLKSRVFRNGDPILEVHSQVDWRHACNNGTPAWSFYDGNPKHDSNYGKIYNYYSITDQRELAPDGWHVPTIKDWEQLIAYLGGNRVAGKKLKNFAGWESKGWFSGFSRNKNISGFNALPGGCITRDWERKDLDKEKNSFYLLIHVIGAWWALDGNMQLYGDNSMVFGKRKKFDGYYVRCIKD